MYKKSLWDSTLQAKVWVVSVNCSVKYTMRTGVQVFLTDMLTLIGIIPAIIWILMRQNQYHYCIKYPKLAKSFTENPMSCALHHYLDFRAIKFIMACIHSSESQRSSNKAASFSFASCSKSRDESRINSLDNRRDYREKETFLLHR